VVLVTARGRLDGSTSPAFAARMEKLAATPQPRLVVDFSGIDFVSSAGLRVVLTLLKRVKAANGVLALCAVQAPVKEVLDITASPACSTCTRDERRRCRPGLSSRCGNSSDSSALPPESLVRSLRCGR